MEYGPELADPLVDVRDVVESFRTYGVTPSDWRLVLANAAAALDELMPKPELVLLATFGDEPESAARGWPRPAREAGV
jgi:hypothetical protein